MGAPVSQTNAAGGSVQYSWGSGGRCKPTSGVRKRTHFGNNCGGPAAAAQFAPLLIRHWVKHASAHLHTAPIQFSYKQKPVIDHPDDLLFGIQHQDTRTLAHRTIAHRTIAHRTIAHRTIAHRTIAYRALAHRTLDHLWWFAWYARTMYANSLNSILYIMQATERRTTSTSLMLSQRPQKTASFYKSAMTRRDITVRGLRDQIR